MGLETLSRRYARPIYFYLRVARARSREDAKDLAQSFFLWLMEKNVLQRYDPRRGSFRNYLKGLLHHFMMNVERKEKRLKRGGASKRLPLSLDGELVDDSAKGNDPEEIFDRAWKEKVLERALERARRHFVSKGRAGYLDTFDAYYRSRSERPPTYGEVAARLKLKGSDVRNHLFTVRDRLRTEIFRELADTVGNMAELQEEWNALFGMV